MPATLTTEVVKLKRCTKCNATKAAVSDNFGKDRTRHDGFFRLVQGVHSSGKEREVR